VAGSADGLLENLIETGRLYFNKRSAMSDTKIIAVVGATGAQGGGLVRATSISPGL
jgi:hypothetical protein